MKPHGKDIGLRAFRKFKDGNQKVFKIIFDQYHQSIYHFAFHYCKHEVEAEEIVQRSFIILYTHRSRIEDSSHIYPYLFVTAKRFVARYFRHRVQQAKFKAHYFTHWQEERYLTDEQLAIQELTRLLHQIIDTLPHKQREIYQLSKLEGLSYEEISVQSGISKHTVKNQLVAANKKVRSTLEKLYLLSVFIFFL